MPAIEVENLSRAFNSLRAVDNVSFSVDGGEIFGFLGHNGAGKTTTVRIVNGLLAPASGTVRVFGQSPLTEGSSVRRRTAVLTESPTLDERLTARETLEAFAAMYDVPLADARPRIGALLEEFGLAERARDRVGGFSRGMKQRLSLARALVHDPDLLFLDEPTAGLDPVATHQLHDTVRQMARTRGRTVVLCTHNLVEAQALSDRVAVLGGGSLLALGTPGELARRISPRLEVTIEIDPTRHADAVALIAALDGLSVASERAGVLRVGGIPRERVPDMAARLVAGGIGL